MKYDLVRPCDQCPFRKDVKPYLRPGRLQDIWNNTENGEFPCHKTVNHDRRDSDSESFCAGMMILREREEQPNQMMRICERLGLYDPSKLDMTSPVFDSLDEAIEANGG